jgi:hypothetical protein
MQTPHRKDSCDTDTLRENDVFGKVFPIGQENISPSFIKAISPAEVIRIHKKSLAELSRRHPDVVEALREICAAEILPGAGGRTADSRVKRSDGRSDLTVKLSIRLVAQPQGSPPLILKGSSNNISVGGACVTLEAPDTGKLPPSLKGLAAKVHVSLPDESISMSILGCVAWAHPVIVNGKVSMVLGIQFKKMTPRLIGYLIVFSEILKSIP